MTFYGLPSEKAVTKWYRETPDSFRFCFKFRQEISHRSALQSEHPLIQEQLQRLQVLGNKLGLLCLQLPASYGPYGLKELDLFLGGLPDGYGYSVEVRHPEFFAKGGAESELHAILRAHQVNRVMFDTRALFANPATDAATLDAFKKKPQVPLHRIATGRYPQVRFISPMNRALAEPYLDQWVEGVVRWIDQGKLPYLFFHTPDNREAPELAARFVEKLELAMPTVVGFKSWNEPGVQTGLFRD